jgi:hypothetical protein
VKNGTLMWEWEDVLCTLGSNYTLRLKGILIKLGAPNTQDLIFLHP